MSLVLRSKKQVDGLAHQHTLEMHRREMKLVWNAVCAELHLPPPLQGSQCPPPRTHLTYSVRHPCERVSWKGMLLACSSCRTWLAHWPFLCSLPTFVLGTNHLVQLLAEDRGFVQLSCIPSVTYLVSDKKFRDVCQNKRMCSGLLVAQFESWATLWGRGHHGTSGGVLVSSSVSL